MVLRIFNAPMTANQFQQVLRAGFLGQEAGYKISRFIGVFDDLALAHGIHDPPDA